MRDAIAVVGMACRFPDAASPRALWENVLARRRAFRRLPRERFDLRDYWCAEGGRLDTTYSTEAAVIEGYAFDRVRFRITGEAYRSADLTHWLALDVAAEALADAGFPDGQGLPRSETGVLIGNTLTGEFSRAAGMRLRWPYVRRVIDARLRTDGWPAERRAGWLEALETDYKWPFPPVTEETLAGGLSNTIAGRVCNFFDLGGGGFTVDGACSSSLLAVAQAASALVAGDLDVALAGGVDLSLDPFELVGFARLGALARREMRVYDRDAEGFWPGEGCGFVVLMRYSDARARGLRCHAVIRGWGVSSDGAGGLTRPERSGQALALERAYRRAGYGIGEVALFEGHGTGTPVGDSIEIAALASARRAADARAPPAVLGSVKANIGHTKAAAGIAGLIKAAMAIEAEVLPPSSGLEHPHPALLAAADCLRAPLEGELWPPGRPLCAGVSAFGFGGIDVHVTLTGTERARRTHLSSVSRALLASAQDAEIFLLGAADRAKLAALVRRVLARAPRLARAELADVAAALAAMPGEFGTRAALVASTPSELTYGLERLAGWLGEGRSNSLDPASGVFLGTGQRLPRIAFLFPGQAAPVYGDGGAFARRFPAVAALYRRASLTALVAEEGGNVAVPGAVVSTALTQPAIVLAEIAGLRVLATLGVQAEVALGHSLGELTALHWAGALGAADLLDLVRARGAAMADVPGPPGVMASVATGEAETSELCAGLEGVVVAGVNAPAQTLVSGEAEAVATLLARAEARGLRATLLPVSHAFHSPQMAPAAVPLENIARHLAWRPLEGRIYSTVTGGLLAREIDPVALLRAQLTRPVRFSSAAAAALAEADLAIEVGPGTLLAGLLDSGASAVPVVSLDVGGPRLRGLLSAVSCAFALGAPVNRSPLFARRLIRPFDLDHRPVFFVNPCELAPPLEGAAAGDREPAPECPPEVTGAVTGVALGYRSLAGDGFGLAAAPLPCSTDAGSTAGERIGLARARAAPQPWTGASSTAAALSLQMPVLERLRARVAVRAELPPEAVNDGARLLADLHLNSIAVSEIVTEVGAELGLTAAASPTEYAGGTLAEIAAALEALVATGGTAATAAPEMVAGVDAWVRAYRAVWVEVGALTLAPETGSDRDRSSGPLAGPEVSEGLRARRAGPSLTSVRTLPPGGCAWEILAPPGDPNIGALHAALSAIPEGSGVLVRLPAGAQEAHFPVLLAGGRRALAPGPAPRRFVVVHEGGPGAAFARTLHLEAPGVVTCVVELPADSHLPARVAAEVAMAEGFHEIRYAPGGQRTRPILELVPEALGAGAVALSDRDVVLVSGGGKGIAAECAAALARATGARVALLGRAAPDDDPELSANLVRLAASGVVFRYLQADVTDPVAVARAVAEAARELGPVTTIVHGAGVNRPVPITALDAEAIERTWAPKVHGLHALLSAVDSARLRLLVGFGSIIARTGLRGEADYGLANEGLALAIEEFGRRHPECRCLTLEWSVWSGVGMGERLGRVEALAREGVAPIGVDQGVDLFLRVLAGPARGALVLCGRVPDLPTLRIARPELPLLRFLERPRIYFPGVELVCDAVLSPPTDLYLDDHRVGGERVFPAVLGLEAMAQAAAAVAGQGRITSFEVVRFERAITVPAQGGEVLRVAALVCEPQVVETVLRCARTGFRVDHFRARCRLAAAGEPGPDRASGETVVAEVDGDVAVMGARARGLDGYGRGPGCHAGPGGPSARVDLEAGRDLYGGLLFHTGRFRRLGEYRHLNARGCESEIIAGDGRAWFGRYLPSELLLGDPGARDAALHALQACVPHARLLPVGVEQLDLDNPNADGVRTVIAVEQWEHDGAFGYDLEVRNAAGGRLESWRGLELRALEPVCHEPWPATLLAVYAERRVAALLSAPDLRLGLFPDGTTKAGAEKVVDTGKGSRAPRGRASARGLATLLGGEVALHRRPDGRWLASGRDDALSTAHAEGLTLAVVGRAPLACDLEAVRSRSDGCWARLLGPAGYGLAARIAAERPEPVELASTRVWAARECLRKAGAALETPLTLVAVEVDDWVVLGAGTFAVASVPATVVDRPGPVVLAVLAGRRDAQL